MKFSFACKYYGKFEGLKKKKAVQLYIGRVNGIAYNYDIFKSYKEVEINALQYIWSKKVTKS